MEQFNKEIIVKGKRYLANHAQVEEAWDIGIELLQMIGGSAAAMAGGAKDEATAAAALSTAVNGLLARVNSKTTLLLIKKVLRHVEFQGNEDGSPAKKMLLDDAGIKAHFHGNIGSMMTLVGEVIAFTHRDFFEALGEGVASLMTMVAEKE